METFLHKHWAHKGLLLDLCLASDTQTYIGTLAPVLLSIQVAVYFTLKWYEFLTHNSSQEWPETWRLRDMTLDRSPHPPCETSLGCRLEMRNVLLTYKHFQRDLHASSSWQTDSYKPTRKARLDRPVFSWVSDVVVAFLQLAAKLGGVTWCSQCRGNCRPGDRCRDTEGDIKRLKASGLVNRCVWGLHNW